MHKTLQDSSQIKVPMVSSKAASLESLHLNEQANYDNDGRTKDVPSCVISERGWKSEEIKGKLDMENDTGIHQKGLVKKSQSLGSALCHEGRVHFDDEIEDEIDQGFSSESLEQNGLVGRDGTNARGVSPVSQQENAPQSESVQVSSELVNNKSIFSIGEPQHLEQEDPANSEILLSGEGANESYNHTPRTHLMLAKSSSMPNMGPSLLFPGGCSYNYMAPHSRSSEDLSILCMRWKEVSFHEVEKREIQEHERNDSGCKTEKINFENSLDDGYDSYNYSALAKDWIVPVTDEITSVKRFQGESLIQQADELQGKDFKIKRIEEWVIDLQHCNPLEETNELSDSIHPLNRDSNVMNGLTAIKRDNKVTPGMETAKRYISSLGASATTAQLSNHGLAVIPFLGAFVSLRVLNLSGNAIVRITAGSLPRGLHVLNLSKNKISTIEGLRELTRLRVLDLSYNRIFRIGHGLASCSSLKELYLAGNKISEVEGLHRLLKLTVLDLRFNKISTAKCLGQLAANYNSLQAISLEGNPAQKNVGDEQLKKYLQSLLPHLVYFNRQPIKVSTLKDAADRSVRLGINAHQFDRGIRSDNKAARKGSHGLGGTRPTSSSTHGRKSQALVSPKPSRGRHARLPPTGTKAITGHRHHYFDIGSKLLNLRSELSIRRSRSEGTLGAL
ncbi:uncharacterized protein LOC8266935 isoform X2 [Ricinus communis]|uniref:Protein phosphatase 1 regulatory subunit, putative n=2 Tax=Ricinus communis TaxID=3988 RepID=B9S9P8_RICCO|nr:uncharacterized protein LOC8266935 isoform X2 [Ricinus communis]XP_048232675.1 uncharacterized protein LOC8266935 isoform X2 [Ricinus communis]EEF39679.1 Protein phosphatase 1 regulatory subunit, putative [Ricinus communis]